MFNSIIYGLINTGDIHSASSGEPDPNHRILEILPLDDDWPRITPAMFAFTGPECVYSTSLIHFAASYKDLERDWELWLEKFETVIRQLSWVDVTLHLKSEMQGNFTYNWLIRTDNNTQDWKPTTNWEFSGGPRKLMLDPSPEDMKKTKTWLDILKRPPGYKNP